jgi:Domain of unknown function (DUF4765)
MNIYNNKVIKTDDLRIGLNNKSSVKNKNATCKKIEKRNPKERLHAAPKSESTGLMKAQVSTIQSPQNLTKILDAYSLSDAEKIKIKTQLMEAYLPKNHPLYGKKMNVANKMSNVPFNKEERDLGHYLLFRGMKSEQLVGMFRYGSAGGRRPADVHVKPPSEKAAVSQVSEKEPIPEFTSDQNVGLRFSLSKKTGTTAFTVVAVEGKYLTRGSESENGWVLDPKAPVQVVAWNEGTALL